MTTITLEGQPINTNGSLPAVGTKAPDFTLVASDLSRLSLKDYNGSRLVLNIFPSIDTGVCAASVKQFNAEAAGLENTKVLCISRDLPFAQSRFCAAEGLDNVITLSDYVNGDFGQSYGVKIVDGPLQGLHSRAVIVIDEAGNVAYNQQVPEIVEEPDYSAALNSLSS